MSRLCHLPSRRPTSAVPAPRSSGPSAGASIAPRAPVAPRASTAPRASIAPRRSSRAPARGLLESIEIQRPSAGDLVIDYAAPGCVIGHVRNMTFSAWNTIPTPEHVEAFMALAKQLCESYPKCSNVTLVMRESELPGVDARVALEELTAQYARYIHSVALVIDGDGFWASMIRSFLTGLHLLRGHGYRCKAFASAAEASPWLVLPHNTETGVTITARELELACEAVYRRMHTEGRPAQLGS